MTQLAHDKTSIYRADIDGLRAIAVLAVVLFHIDPAWLPGGFAGVDIFFVISGYLITGNIIKDVQSSRGFSWAEFYRRRILRILPVLFVVLLVVMLCGQFLMLPSDLQELGWASLAAVFSVSNVYFTYFLDTSYFADDSSLQPLLHLWSLGVEEQFYLFWPVILVLLLGRLGRQRLLLLSSVLAVLSFALAEWLLSRDPMFAYYMLPPRAGELLIGAMLALYLSGGKRQPGPREAAVSSIVGLLLVAVSLVWITEDLGFPGMTALPSTLGAALIIFAGSAGVQAASRLLAIRPMVWVGLISYSLYLWHWPVLAFYRYMGGEETLTSGLLLLLLMVVLSVLSYHLVERPCRKMRLDFGQTFWRVFTGGSVAVTVGVAALLFTKGYGVYALDGDYRVALTALEPAQAAYKYPYVCQRPELSQKELNSHDCMINSDQEPNVLLWGDSNAAHYVGVIGAIAEKAGFGFRNAAHSSCPPVLYGAEHTQKPERLERCLRSISIVSQALDRYSTVILGGAWASYFASSPEFAGNLERTVDELLGRGKQVIILGQVPNFVELDRKCMQKQLKLTMLDCQSSSSESDRGDTEVNLRLKRLVASRPGVSYYNVRDALCNGSHCSAYLKGKLLFFDKSHLSMDGSWLLGYHWLESHGMPQAFQHLVSSDRVSKNSLQESLHNRGAEHFQAPGDRWTSLLDEHRFNEWKSKGSFTPTTGSFEVDDRSAERFELIRYRLRERDLQELAAGGQLLLQARLSSCTGSIPLLRTAFEIEGRQQRYDLVFDCQSRKIKVKGHLARGDVRVFAGDVDHLLQMRMFVPVGVREVTVEFYPAVGDELGRYQQQATGRVRIDQLSFAVQSVQGNT